MKHAPIWLWAVLMIAGCQSTPNTEVVVYRGVSRRANAEAMVAILRCLPQPECNELLGDRLTCGPFLWRQLAGNPTLATLTNVTTYTIPQNLAGGSQEVTWEGRQCEDSEQVRALWRAFVEKIPEESLPIIRSLNNAECRIYSALVPGEIHEPVFILEGSGHKILMQLAKINDRLTLTFFDDFRNISVKD